MVVLRLLAFFFFALGLAAIGGDALRAFTSHEPFALRSAAEWWQLSSTATYEFAQDAFAPSVWDGGVAPALALPAPVVLGAAALLMLGLITLLHRAR